MNSYGAYLILPKKPLHVRMPQARRGGWHAQMLDAEQTLPERCGARCAPLHLNEVTKCEAQKAEAYKDRWLELAPTGHIHSGRRNSKLGPEDEIRPRRRNSAAKGLHLPLPTSRATAMAVFRPISELEESWNCFTDSFV